MSKTGWFGDPQRRKTPLEAEVESLRAENQELQADAEEARKVRGALSLAAPPGYAVAHIKELQADLQAAEAKLAIREEDCDAKEEDLIALEAKLADAEAETEMLSVAARSKLAEVEKERDELLDEQSGRRHTDEVELRYKVRLLKRVEQARELEKVVREWATKPEGYGKVRYTEAMAALDDLARILSVDEGAYGPDSGDSANPTDEGEAT